MEHSDPSLSSLFVITRALFLLLIVAWLLNKPMTSVDSSCEAVVLILSTPSARIKRDAIRESWLAELKQQYPSFVFKYAFVLGMSTSRSVGGLVREERVREGDLLLLPFVDHYWNLTTKVSMAFKSAFVLRSRCRIVVKIDDDVFVRAPRFVAMLRRLPSFDLFGGYVYDQRKRVMRVVRTEEEPTNKFSFSRAELPQFLFAPYASGPIYFMSLGVAARLPPFGHPSNVTASDPLARLEDAYVGRLVASMVPPVAFWHVPKIILEATDSRAPELIALHNVRVPGAMLHGRATFGLQKSLIIQTRPGVATRAQITPR